MLRASEEMPRPRWAWPERRGRGGVAGTTEGVAGVAQVVGALVVVAGAGRDLVGAVDAVGGT